MRIKRAGEVRIYRVRGRYKNKMLSRQQQYVRNNGGTLIRFVFDWSCY